MDIEFETSGVDESISHAVLCAKYRLFFTAEPLQAFSLDSRGELKSQWPWRNIGCLQLSSDDRTLAVGNANLIKLLESESGRETRTLVDHTSVVKAVAPFSRCIYTWVSGDEDGVCRVSDARRHPSTVLTMRAARPLRCVRASPDDSLLIIGDDTSLQIWDIRQRKQLPRFPFSTNGVAFHPTECLMAAWGEEGVVRYWDLDTFECVSQSEPFGPAIRRALFTPDGDSLLVLTDRKIRALGWEPCQLKWSSALPPSSQRVLFASVSDGSAGGRLQCLTSSSSCQLQLLSGSLDNLSRPLSVPSTPSSVLHSAVPLQPPRSLPTSTSISSHNSLISLSMASTPSSVLSYPLDDVVCLPTPELEEQNIRVMESTPAARRTAKPPLPAAPRQGSRQSMAPLEQRRRKASKEKRPGVKRGEEEANVIATIEDLHPLIMQDMADLEQKIRQIRDATRRGADEAIAEAGQLPFLLAALSRHFTERAKWTLSSAAAMLCRLHCLLAAEMKEHRMAGLSALASIISAFGSLISTTVSNGGVPSIGVDVAADARIAHCRQAHDALCLLSIRQDELSSQLDESERSELRALLTLANV